MKSVLHEFRERKTFFLLVLLELLFAVVAVFSFLSMLGFNLFKVIETKKLPVLLGINFFDAGLFVLSLVFFAVVYFAIRKKFPSLFKAQQKAFFEIKLTAKEKFSNAKTDARPIGLLIIEFCFVAVVFISLSALFDPQFELLPWHKIGFAEPLITMLNAIAAIIVLAMFYWLYSKTSDYRTERYGIKAKHKKRNN